MSDYTSRYNGSEEAVRNFPWNKKSCTEPDTERQSDLVPREQTENVVDSCKEQILRQEETAKPRRLAAVDKDGKTTEVQRRTWKIEDKTDGRSSLFGRYLALKALDRKMASDFLWNALWNGYEQHEQSDDPLDDILSDLAARIKDYRLRSRRARDAARRRSLKRKRPKKKNR